MRAPARHWPARPPTSRADTAPNSRDRPPRRRAPARRWAARLAAWAPKPVVGPEHGAAARLRRPTRHSVAAGTTAPAGQAGPLPAVAGRWVCVPFSAGAIPARARPPVTSAEKSRNANVAAASRGYVPTLSQASVARRRPRRARRFVDRRLAESPRPPCGQLALPLDRATLTPGTGLGRDTPPSVS